MLIGHLYYWERSFVHEPGEPVHQLAKASTPIFFLGYYFVSSGWVSPRFIYTRAESLTPSAYLLKESSTFHMCLSPQAGQQIAASFRYKCRHSAKCLCGNCYGLVELYAFVDSRTGGELGGEKRGILTRRCQRSRDLDFANVACPDMVLEPWQQMPDVWCCMMASGELHETDIRVYSGGDVLRSRRSSLLPILQFHLHLFTHPKRC